MIATYHCRQTKRLKGDRSPIDKAADIHYSNHKTIIEPQRNIVQRSGFDKN